MKECLGSAANDGQDKNGIRVKAKKHLSENREPIIYIVLKSLIWACRDFFSL